MPEVLTQVDPKDSIAKLSGSDLSALVCERVFDEPMPPAPVGCALFIDRVQRSPQGAWLHVHIFEYGDKCEWIPRPFAEAIEAAMEVVEMMRERDWRVSMMNNPGVAKGEFEWSVDFARGRVVNRMAATLPEAICHAALAATENNS